jgi:hypothetical protein
MKECDAPESNSTTAEVVDEKHTNDNIRSFLRFFHGHMIDFPMGVVVLGSNRNRVGSMGRGRCSYSGLIGTSV